MSLLAKYKRIRARLSPAAWKAALKNAAGTTLIESVCGILILTTIVVSMYAGILTAQKVLGEGDTREQQGQAAFAALERGEGETGAEQQFRLDLGGVKVSFSGQYAQAGGTDGGATLYSFDTGTVSFADGVRNFYIYWQTRLKNMPKSEWSSVGYNETYISNDLLREFIKNKEYKDESADEGVWPLFPVSFLERYLTDAEKVEEAKRSDNLLSVPNYIQPYHSYERPPGNDVNINCIAYVSSVPINGNWNTRLIYDHDEKAWYYRPRGNVAYIANKEWAVVKAYIHGPEWRKLV